MGNDDDAQTTSHGGKRCEKTEKKAAVKSSVYAECTLSEIPGELKPRPTWSSLVIMINTQNLPYHTLLEASLQSNRALIDNQDFPFAVRRARPENKDRCPGF